MALQVIPRLIYKSSFTHPCLCLYDYLSRMTSDVMCMHLAGATGPAGLGETGELLPSKHPVLHFTIGHSRQPDFFDFLAKSGEFVH